DGYVSGGQSHREQSERSAGKDQAERHQLVSEVRAVVAKSPDAVERNFQGQKNSGGSNQQHGQRKHLCLMVFIDQRIQVPDHEFLSGGKRIAQQALQYFVHHAGMEDVLDQRHQQEQEREERQNGIGGNGEGEGVHFGPEQVVRGGAHQAFGGSSVILGRALRVGKLDGSQGRH